MADRPQDDDKYNKGGNSYRDKNTGSIHHTSYGNGGHISHDEDSKGNVSGLHSTDHKTDKKTNHQTDSNGNPK